MGDLRVGAGADRVVVGGLCRVSDLGPDMLRGNDLLADFVKSGGVGLVEIEADGVCVDGGDLGQVVESALDLFLEFKGVNNVVGGQRLSV